MKINKKVVCLAAAAVMAVSSVSAFAATLPMPKDNNEAFTLAESFYFDGLYYEAKEELQNVDASGAYYDEAKAVAWTQKVDLAISKMEKQKLFNQVQALNDAGLFYEAAAVLDVLNSRSDITQNDYYSLRWWEEAVAKNIAALEKKAVKIVRSEASAINRVKAYGYTLATNEEWFSPVQVANGYHVYVKTQLPGGGSKDVAAFRVYTDGTVERAF